MCTWEQYLGVFKVDAVEIRKLELVHDSFGVCQCIRVRITNGRCLATDILFAIYREAPSTTLTWGITKRTGMLRRSSAYGNGMTLMPGGAT